MAQALEAGSPVSLSLGSPGYLYADQPSGLPATIPLAAFSKAGRMGIHLRTWPLSTSKNRTGL